jgi:glycine/D-amino acid oxidase-like deaminating enzyme
MFRLKNNSTKSNSMRQYEVIIVGSGLFGSAIAKHLTKHNVSVLILDSKEPLAASKCSFGIFKEGWINDKIKSQVSDGLEILEELSDGFTEIEFYNRNHNDRIDRMIRADCSKILDLSNFNVENCKVQKVVDNRVEIEKGEPILATKAVILATGAFTNNILLKSGYGACLA